MHAISLSLSRYKKVNNTLNKYRKKIDFASSSPLSASLLCAKIYATIEQTKCSRVFLLRRVLIISH
jgi:hypothetical protein